MLSRIPQYCLLLACLCLSACGFRLAGTAALPDSIASIYLVAPGLSDSQRARLTERLERAGATVSRNATDGATQLAVSLGEVPDRTLVNSTQNGITVERLARRLDYSIKSADGEVLIEPTSLLQRRDVTLDDDNLHSSNRERREVLESLEIALFNLLIHRLQRL